MLVYLDTAHLALLDRAAGSESDAFWSAWQACGCELALSLHHLQEIGQLSDRVSANRRLNVLASFQRIRSRGVGSERVLSLEIQLQLYQLAGHGVDVQRSARESLFPLADSAHLLDSVEFQPVFKQMRLALEMGAEAETTSKEANRASQLDPDAPIDPMWLNSAEAEQALDEALADAAPDVALFVRTMAEQVRASIIEQGTVRGGLEALYGLQDVAVREAIPYSDLAAVSTFFNQAVRETVDVISQLNLPESHLNNLAKRLNPYLAPGFALQLAVQRARKLHPQQETAGDQVDAAHIAFAPYVDLAFVDKRTLGFITQEARDRPHLLAPAFTTNITKAGTLDRVAQTIRMFHERRVTT